MGFQTPFKAGTENSSNKDHLNYKEKKINWDHMSGKELKLGGLFRVRNIKCLSSVIQETQVIKTYIFLNHSSVINLQPIKGENWTG